MLICSSLTSRADVTLYTDITWNFSVYFFLKFEFKKNVSLSCTWQGSEYRNASCHSVTGHRPLFFMFGHLEEIFQISLSGGGGVWRIPVLASKLKSSPVSSMYEYTRVLNAISAFHLIFNLSYCHMFHRYAAIIRCVQSLVKLFHSVLLFCVTQLYSRGTHNHHHNYYYRSSSSSSPLSLS